MDYQLLAFRQSPNYTPASQVKYFYGRVRTLEFIAGHWWDDPARNPSFSGVVNVLMNPARQASANDVVGDQIVQPLVRAADASWATGVANPFTYSFEVDPHIIYKWWAGGDKAKAERIFQTLAKRIADLGYHNLPARPHKFWMNTGCNPIPWDEVMARAKQIVADRNKPKYQWVNMDNPRTMLANVDLRPLNLANGQRVGDIIKKGTPIEFNTKAEYNGTLFLRTKYSTSHGLNNGIEFSSLKEVEPEYIANDQPMIEPRVMEVKADTRKIEFATGNRIQDTLVKGRLIPFARKTTIAGKLYLITAHDSANKNWLGIPFDELLEYEPEWTKNLEDLALTELYVLPAEGTPVYNLNTGEKIPDSVIAKGTAISILGRTKVGTQEYYLTSYAVKNNMPNGLKVEAIGKPVVEPENPKPSWLDELEDIEDVIMYTRADVPLVNLLTGETVKIIPINTPIEVDSYIEWFNQDYFLTKYSTVNKQPHGIKVVDLAKDPIKDPDQPLEPDPEQPSLEERVGALEKIINAIKKWLNDKFGTNF